MKGGQRRVGNGCECFDVMQPCSFLSRLQPLEGFALPGGLESGDQVLPCCCVWICILFVVLKILLALFCSATLSAGRVVVASAAPESHLASLAYSLPCPGQATSRDTKRRAYHSQQLIHCILERGTCGALAALTSLAWCDRCGCGAAAGEGAGCCVEAEATAAAACTRV